MAKRIQERLLDQSVVEREGCKRTVVAVKGQGLDPGAERPHAAMAVGVTDVQRIAGRDAPGPPVSLPACVRHIVKRQVGFLLVEDPHPGAPVRLAQFLGE